MNQRERQALRLIKDLPARLAPVEDDHPAWDCDLQHKPTMAWRSREFVVQLIPEGQDRLRLTVQRSRATAWFESRNKDLRPISWDDLMEVKRQVGYGDWWAIEVYPSDDHVIDACPMRHLWLLDTPPPQAWLRKKGP